MINCGVEGSPCLSPSAREILRLRRPSFVPAALNFGVGSAQDDTLEEFNMKISIIGGGPAGLYFALLMKKHDPANDVTVYERNAPNDTFGWGVVFSDKTLTYLRDNDRESFERITATFETWDNVDVVYRTEKISVRGNKFSGIARIALLNILQRRCEELGVD